jgi:hypothetical protein
MTGPPDTASAGVEQGPTRAAAARSACVPGPASYCRLTTFAWNGAELETRAALGVGEGRVYVRLPATNPVLECIWNSASARVVPCTPRGRPTGPPVEGEARILCDGEDAPARRALGGGPQSPSPLRRLAHDEDELYVEIVPAPRRA